MRQGSSVPSSESLSQGLHPVLQAALDSLDVELEEELIRYRRQKYRQAKQVGQKSTLSWRSSHPSSPKSPVYPVDLPRFSPSDEGEVRQEPGMELQPTSIAVASRPSPSPARSVNVQPKAAPLPDLWVTPADPSFGPRATEGKMTTVAGYTSPALETASNLETTSNTEASTFALMAIEPNATSQDITQTEFGQSPDDYLASSEELLRSIAEEPADLRAERESNLMDTLLTPLGIGSMLLLLLSSVTLGYVIMHPSSLDGLVSQGSSSGENASSTSSEPVAASASIPNSPNLAADEFVDINIGTLSTLPRNGSRSAGSASTTASATASGTAKPKGSTSSTQSSSTTNSADSIANLPPEPVLSAPAAASAPVSEAPTAIDPPAYVPEYSSDPAPQVATAVTSGAASSSGSGSSGSSSSASSSETTSSTASSGASVSTSSVASASSSGSGRAAASNYYYVVTPYNGDPSLEEARTAVPDAYVRNFSSGASVQLGAFSDPQKAEDLVQQLEQQGISAELYQPN